MTPTVKNQIEDVYIAGGVCALEQFLEHYKKRKKGIGTIRLVKEMLSKLEK